MNSHLFDIKKMRKKKKKIEKQAFGTWSQVNLDQLMYNVVCNLMLSVSSINYIIICKVLDISHNSVILSVFPECLSEIYINTCNLYFQVIETLKLEK